MLSRNTALQRFVSPLHWERVVVVVVVVVYLQSAQDGVVRPFGADAWEQAIQAATWSAQVYLLGRHDWSDRVDDVQTPAQAKMKDHRCKKTSI